MFITRIYLDNEEQMTQKQNDELHDLYAHLSPNPNPID